MAGPSDIEIRPLWEAEDFEPKLAARVGKIGAKSGGRRKA
jgi:hypothetical protein